MSLNLFRRLDRYDRRIRQLERTEPPEGGGGGGDHVDSDHADAFSALGHAHAGTYAPVEHDTTHDDRFSLLAHTHAVHADSDHDDRFSLLAHTHAGVGAHTHDWADVTGEPATFPPTPQALDWLTDVATAGAATGRVLTYNGTSWVPQIIPTVSWTDVTGKPSTFPADPHDLDHADTYLGLDAMPTGGSTGQALVKTSGANYDTEWASAGAPIPQPLDWLTDVSAAAPTDKQVLYWQAAASQWWAGNPDVYGTGPDSSYAPGGMFWPTGVTVHKVLSTQGYPGAVDGTVFNAKTGFTGEHIQWFAPVGGGLWFRKATDASTWAAAWAPVPVSGAWQSVAGTYFTGWGAVAGDQAPRYRLEGDTVRLDGAAGRTSGSLATMFTLPSGFRPTQVKRFWPAGGASAAVRIAVGTDGIVSQTAGTDFTRTSLEGCSFPIT